METDILNMADEDFAKLSTPDQVTTASEEAPAEETETKDEKSVDPVEPKPTEEPAAQTEPEEKPAEQEAKDEAEPAPALVDPAAPKTPEVKASQPKEEAVKTDEPAPKVETPVPAKTGNSDYEAFFKQVMAPFKANGKTIQLESVDDVIRLMQMGANYTKKMQALQANKKFLMMLENNGLLDENKLSFYIDLEKKNPEAIKKFLKDSKIDPVDVDTTSEVNYKSGSHAVTDQEASLASAIEDLNSMPGGKETLQSVHAWDSASKKALWDSPELLAIIHTQKENGIYDRISNEIERRKTLGQVSPNIPFLQAYKLVGDEMNAKNAFGTTKSAVPAQQPVARTPVAVRPAKTPATKATDSKVRAAAAPRTVSRPAKTNVNVLAMSDEEFLKLSNKV